MVHVFIACICNPKTAIAASKIAVCNGIGLHVPVRAMAPQCRGHHENEKMYGLMTELMNYMVGDVKGFMSVIIFFSYGTSVLFDVF